MSLRTVVLPATPALARLAAPLAWPLHHPGDELDYALDAAKFFADAGDHLAYFAAATSSPDVAIVRQSFAGDVATVVLGGGSAGNRYAVTFTLYFAGDPTLRKVAEVWLPVDVAAPLGGPPLAASVPAGPAGPAGQAGGFVTLVAGPGGVSGHRALMPDGQGGAVHADPAAPAYQFLGISTGAAAPGTPVQAAAAGALVAEPSWAWTPGAALYCGAASGALTAIPPASGVLQQVAVAVAPTTVLVQPFAPITRH